MHRKIKNKLMYNTHDFFKFYIDILVGIYLFYKKNPNYQIKSQNLK
jgi:hypothetical protein